MTELKWMVEAKKYLGLKEGPGTVDNPTVVGFYKDSGHPEVKHDAVAWCAAFVGAMLHRAGLKGTGTLWALDYGKWGVELKQPVYGCIATKTRTGGGHVGFVVGMNATHIMLLGGNQHDSVCYATFPREEFNHFRWPSDVPVVINKMLPVNVGGVGEVSQA